MCFLSNEYSIIGFALRHFSQIVIKAILHRKKPNFHEINYVSWFRNFQTRFYRNCWLHYLGGLLVNKRLLSMHNITLVIQFVSKCSQIWYQRVYVVVDTAMKTCTWLEEYQIMFPWSLSSSTAQVRTVAASTALMIFVITPPGVILESLSLAQPATHTVSPMCCWWAQ